MTNFLKFFWDSPNKLLILTTLMWAGHANVLKISIGEVSPMLLMGFRWIGCFLILSTFLWSDVKTFIPKEKKNLLWVFLMGGLGMAGFTICLVIAAQHTTVINLGIAQSFIPALVMIIGLVFLKTSITKEQSIGLIVSVCGALILITGGSLKPILSLEFNVGDLIMLVGCICYAAYTVGLTNRLRMPPTILFVYFSFFATITLSGCVAVEYLQGKLVWPSKIGWISIMYCIIFPSILSQTFFMRGVELIGANRAGLYVNLVPIFTALIAIVMLSEKLYFFHLISLLMVLSGIYITEKFKRT